MMIVGSLYDWMLVRLVRRVWVYRNSEPHLTSPSKGAGTEGNLSLTRSFFDKERESQCDLSLTLSFKRRGNLLCLCFVEEVRGIHKVFLEKGEAFRARDFIRWAKLLCEMLSPLRPLIVSLWVYGGISHLIYCGSEVYAVAFIVFILRFFRR